MPAEKSEVMVSVYCAAFNHARYIRKTLDGFVMQRTSFPFEVIIHDDASTDETAEIIREYAEKHPFIRPIFQQENQYSKGISIAREYVYPVLHGKYIAYCEGDDYWTDEYKLQKQVDYMEAHPACTMVCHGYNLIEAENEQVLKAVRTREGNGMISPEIAMEYKNPTQLATQMYRLEQVRNMPDTYYGYGIGDYTLLLYAAQLGPIYYFDEIMVNKRHTSKGSWTERVYRDPEKRVRHLENMKAFLHTYNRLTDSRFAKAVEKRIQTIDFDISLAQFDFKKARSNGLYTSVSKKRKLIIMLGCICPKLARTIERTFANR